MSKWEIFWRQFYELGGYENFLTGLKNTAYIAVFGLLIGMVLGCLLATFKLLPGKGFFNRFLGIFTDVYVAIFRGTPMLVQLLLIHFVVFPVMGIDISPVLEAIIAFGLNSGAFVSEIMRGGILSVDIGQTEAGRALGLSYGSTMMKIVLPQAIKNILPALGNEFISLIKETSVASFVTTVDIYKAFNSIANHSHEYIVPYLAMALVYIILVAVITLLVKLMERRLSVSDKRTASK